MIFKYGSFFGISAVNLMFMTKDEIDDIFRFDVKPSTLLLIKNLYAEVEALRCIFDTKATEGLPHAILSVDIKDKGVEHLVNGFNYYLAMKERAETEVLEDAESAAKTIDDLSEDFGDLDDVDLTSYFSENEKEPEIRKSDNQKSDLDALFDDLADVDLDETKSLLNLEDSSFNESDTLESILNDLIAAGERHPDVEKKVPNFMRLTSYMVGHKDDFSEEEYEQITKQLANLPRLIKMVEKPIKFKERILDISEKNKGVLKALYSNMMRPVTGSDATFIDYVREKLSIIILTNSDIIKQLFFSPRARFSRNIAINECNRLMTNLNQGYLFSSDKRTVLGNIKSLIADCEETLGKTSDSLERQRVSDILTRINEFYGYEHSMTFDHVAEKTDILEELVSLFGEENILTTQRTLTLKFFELLMDSGHINALLANIDNLRMILAIYNASQHATREILSSLDRNIDDPGCAEDFISFTRETGICGLTIYDDEQILKTLTEIEAPLIKVKATVFDEDTVNWRMSYLLRKHLLSLQNRILTTSGG